MKHYEALWNHAIWPVRAQGEPGHWSIRCHLVINMMISIISTDEHKDLARGSVLSWVCSRLFQHGQKRWWYMMIDAFSRHLLVINQPSLQPLEHRIEQSFPSWIAFFLWYFTTLFSGTTTAVWLVRGFPCDHCDHRNGYPIIILSHCCWWYPPDIPLISPWYPHAIP